MKDQHLFTTIDDRGVARVTMNRPDVRNAFNTALINEICDTMGRLSSDSNIRVIVLTGAGKAFSAGADLNMMKEMAGFSAAENRDDARRLAHMLQSIYTAPKPTIALVNGPAMGGGLGLIAACDIAIASEDAFFALSEVRLGLIPAVISPFVVQAMGVRQARRYFLTAERFSAETAADLGLVHIVSSPDGLDASLDGVVDDLLMSPPGAHLEAKELIRSVKFRPVSPQVLSDTAELIAKRRASTEGKEGISAFLEKRKPSWI